MGRKPTLLVLHALLVGVCASLGFLDYQIYNDLQIAGNLRHESIIEGTAGAPWQYRIMVHRIAESLNHYGLDASHSLGMIDLLCALVALQILLYLWRVRYARRVDDHDQYVYLIWCVVFSQYGLFWLNFWFQEPYTLPSLLFIVFSCVVFDRCVRRGFSLFTLLSICSLAIIQSFNRADVAFAAGVGFCVYFILNRSERIRARKATLIAASSLLIIASVVVQYQLQWVLYPGVPHESTVPVQLTANISIRRLIPFLLYMAPIYLTVRFFWPQKRVFIWEFDIFHAVVFAAIAYFPLWVTFGKIDEVRIFAPFSIPIVHYSALYLVQLRRSDTE